MTSVELEDLLPGTITEEEVEKERRKYHGAARQEPDCNADPDADSGTSTDDGTGKKRLIRTRFAIRKKKP